MNHLAALLLCLLAPLTAYPAPSKSPRGGTCVSAYPPEALVAPPRGGREGALPLPTDTLRELVVAGGVKQFGTLGEQPLSSQTLVAEQLRATGAGTLKDMARFVPNLFYPDYGSRLTSALYIRGVGSRAATPAVGMYVDDVALMEKSSFDQSLADAERVDVLRGPQSTLYGRGTMGGVMRLYTRSPLQDTLRTDIRLGASTQDAMREAYARHTRRLRPGLALALSAFYRGADGYNRNTLLDRKSNGSDGGGGRLRLCYSRSPRFLLDFQSAIEQNDEDAYDYYAVSDGLTRQNFLGGYRRTLQSNSLKLETRQRHFTLTSITAYQFLRDRMLMDQDYTDADLFRLEQRQRSHSLSEEIVLKGNSLPWLHWTAGTYLAHQRLRTDAPVTFEHDGIQQLIQAGINRGFDAANAAMQPMGMSLAMTVTDPQLVVDGSFTTPVTSAALFGQASFRDLLTPGLDLTAGLRLDHEHRSLDYNTGATAHFTFQMQRGAATLVDRAFDTPTRYDGHRRDHQTRLLPSLSLSYRLGGDADQMVYATVSQGLRSGGYNIQMFSDLIQSALRSDMMRTLAADPQIGAHMSAYVTPTENPSADTTIVFRPETSWNYEVGTHLHFFHRQLTLSAALFCIQVSDLQVTRFAAAQGLGRQVANTGRSRSLGAELSATGWFPLFRHPLRLRASYGYTHATFTHYDPTLPTTNSALPTTDYTGNHVPFAPLHTLALGAEYSLPIGRADLRIGADATGSGRTYWTEANSASDPFCLLLGAHAAVAYRGVTLTLWGRNLSDRTYRPFYFESMGQGYAQRCRPRQFGIQLSATF